MKRLVSNKFSIAISALLCSNAPFMVMPLTSCSNSNTIQLANYESYMAENLINDLQDNYSIQFPYYTVAEMIPAKFEKFYDIAVPCGYELMALLRNGWLEKLDWAKFEVEDMNHTSIDSAEKAKGLFVDEVDGYSGLAMMNQQFTEYINAVYTLDKNDKLIKVLIKDEILNDQGKFITPDGKFNILNYGVPYFAQSFMFAYTGTPITFYKVNTETVTTTPSWADIFYTISPANPHQDERFQKKKIAMVDDARSFYDVSRIVESVKENPEKVTNVVTEDDSRDRMLQTMNHITSNFKKKKNSFILNSDSQIVSKSLADRKGDACGIMSWSGDTIYAAQGAEEYEAFTSENLHIMKPAYGSLDEIEFMVMNNKNLKKTAKRDNIYKVVKQCCLDGCELSPEEIVEWSDEKDRYESWSMTNWDNILYTPMLKNIYQAVCKKGATKEDLSEYWQSAMDESGYSLATINDLFIEILNGAVPTQPKPCQHLYGKTLTALQNSNNHWAWLESRGKL